MREFFLENEYGQKFFLNKSKTGFFQNPAGLGYAMETGYTKLGTTWTRNQFTDSQAQISGDIVFGTDAPYTAAADFFAWIRRAGSIVLHKVTTAGEYLRDVDVVSCDLKEIGDGGYLTVPVVFAAKSLWYSKDVRQYVLMPDSIGRTMRYDYRLDARYHDAGLGKIELDNDGSVEAPFFAVFNGPITNPVLSIKKGGATVSTVSITGSALVGETIEYSSVDNKLFCEKVTQQGRTNLVGSFNIENTNFFKVPIGESEAHVTADTALTQPIMITVYKQYRAV